MFLVEEGRSTCCKNNKQSYNIYDMAKKTKRQIKMANCKRNKQISSRLPKLINVWCRNIFFIVT